MGAVKPGLVLAMGAGLAGLAALGGGAPVLTPPEVGLLALAALRAGRMVAYDLVAEPFRRPFAQTVRDSYGAAETTEARYATGWKADIGQLLTCPICAGTWCAAAMLGLLVAWPALGWLVVYVFAAAGGAEIGNALLEGAQWGGELARSRVGCDNAARRVARLAEIEREALGGENGNG